MPAEIYQGPFAEPITSQTAGLTYLIRAATDERDARDTLINEAPLLYDNKIQDDYEITDLKVPGGGWFKATVKYKAKATGLPSGGGGQDPVRGIEFSIGGVTRLVQVHTGNSVTVVAGGWTQKVPTGIVNARLTSLGRYEIVGAQMPAKVMSFRIKKRFSAGTLTDDVVDLIEDLTDCVNDKPFLRWPAGTVIFDGAEGGQSGIDGDVTFNFRKGPEISQTTDGIEWTAGPFDHVWMLDVPNTSGGETVTTIKEIHINQKDREDFGLLPL